MADHKIKPLNGQFGGASIISIEQFDKQDIDRLFLEAMAMQKLVEVNGGNNLLSGKILANIFYEPSTRTSSSFESAMKRLGGDVVQINNVNYSSVAKGESVRDTLRTLEQYSDVTVLRHNIEGTLADASSVASNPLINAGDGVGEHPTQALLDLFTIKQTVGHLQNLSVVMVGDLLNGRTVHSLSKLLALYQVNIKFVAPKELTMPLKYKKYLEQKGCKYTEYDNVESALAGADVLYMTRVQKERFNNQNEYERLKGAFILDTNLLKKAPKKLSIMHPLPRVGEIAEEVDKDPRAKYFEQMKYGMYVRMALLALVLNKSMLKG